MGKKVTNVREQVLSGALQAVNGSRNLNYGEPKDNFLRIARLWNAHVLNIGMVAEGDSRFFTPVDVAIMLGFVKDGRLANQPDHLDSWMDKAGYAACGAEVSQK